MPTTADLSDAPKHTIKTVCAQTGILPVTLRAWERRYKLLQPRRTSGNYRLYSDRDIALLRWIKSRMDVGTTIGRVADEFHAMRRAGQWPVWRPPQPRPHLSHQLRPRTHTGNVCMPRWWR